MKLGVGEYVADKDLNVFYAKTKRGALHKQTASQTIVSPILHTFPPTLKSFNIPSIFLLVQE
jgi:hypothetical protein